MIFENLLLMSQKVVVLMFWQVIEYFQRCGIVKQWVLAQYSPNWLKYLHEYGESNIIYQIRWNFTSLASAIYLLGSFYVKTDILCKKQSILFLHYSPNLPKSHQAHQLVPNFLILTKLSLEQEDHFLILAKLALKSNHCLDILPLWKKPQFFVFRLIKPKVIFHFL